MRAFASLMLRERAVKVVMHRDLAKFIAAGRLNFSIDKVNGVVETNRPDARNAHYEQVVKQVRCSPPLP